MYFQDERNTLFFNTLIRDYKYETETYIRRIKWVTYIFLYAYSIKDYKNVFIKRNDLFYNVTC